MLKKISIVPLDLNQSPWFPTSFPSAPALPKKEFKDDVKGLEAALASIQLKVNGAVGPAVPFLETLRLTSACPSLGDAEDDLAREKALYAQALAALVEAQDKVKGGVLTLRRPEDYYAEMLKTDAHMGKVKQRLLQTQRRMEDVAAKRKHRDSAKFAIQVAAERSQQRAKSRAAEEDAIRKWRRQHGKNEADEFPEELLDPNSALRQQLAGGPPAPKEKVYEGLAQAPKTPKPKTSKTILKAQKYGMGGKRGKNWRSNTSDSANDFSDWSTRRNKTPEAPFRRGSSRGGARGGRGGRGGGRGGGAPRGGDKAQRPGKRARQRSGSQAGSNKRPRTQ